MRTPFKALSIPAPVCYAFVLGLCATLLLWMAYPYGLIAPDTYDYLHIGQSLWSPTSILYEEARGPALPVALILATHTSNPGAVILWMNGLFFALCMAAIAWIGTCIFRRNSAVWVLVGVVILLEIVINQPFLYIAFALTDGPAALLLCAGTMLAVGGWMRSSKSALFLGFLCLGLTEAFRPMMLIPFFWSCIWLWMYLHKNARAVMNTTLLCCLVALLLPMGSWYGRNAVFGLNRANPFIGFHLLTHADKLFTNNDQVFDDPVVNAAFHTARHTLILPPLYEGPNLFGDQPAYWRTLFLFLTSQLPLYKEKGWDRQRFGIDVYRQEFADLSLRISLEAIRTHPLGYLYQVKEKYIELYNTYLDDNYLQSFMTPDGTSTYVQLRNAEAIPPSLKEIFLPAQTWQASPVTKAAAFLLFAISAPLHFQAFLYKTAFWYMVLVHGCALFAVILLFSRRLKTVCGYTMEQGRLLAMIIVSLFLTTTVFYVVTAMLTTIQDIRYSGPGMMPSHLIVLLTGAALLSALRTFLRRQHV